MIEAANLNGFGIKHVGTSKTCRKLKGAKNKFTFLAPDVFTKAYSQIAPIAHTILVTQSL
jgi:hypothetical protein